MMHTGNRVESQVQVGTALHTSVTLLWMQVATWLDRSDDEWAEQCWKAAEANPFLEVVSNPDYHPYLWPVESTVASNPWTEWEWLMTLAEVENMLSLVERRAFRYWWQALDAHGLVSCTVPEVASQTGVAPADARRALWALQSLDPPGIGARSVPEAVWLQLQRLGLDGSVERDILQLPLADWLREPTWLARVTASTVPQVTTAMEHIRRCRPYPLIGRDDHMMSGGLGVSLWAQRQGSQGEWKIEVNDPYMLRCRRRDLAEPRANSGTAWHSMQENAIQWMKVMGRRRDVLMAVTHSIVVAQAPFCLGDALSPRALTVAQVAPIAGVHETTVQRVLHNRVIALPRGILRLRQLVPGASADRRTIQHRIRYWIEHGARSDRIISQCLEREGFCVPRRTVAKWRRELGLTPPRGRSAP